MCGIVGVVIKSSNGFSKDQQDAFTEMLLCDSVRGDDATGVFSVDNKGKVVSVKQATPSGVFVETDVYKSWSGEIFQRGLVAVGHNRKRTVGVNTSKNAHPFHYNPVILVHNGNISNHKALDKDVEVDSEAACRAIAKEKDTVKALKSLEGAMSLCWYHLEHGTLNLYRNSQRPLFYVDHSSYFAFASEGKMLDWILSRNNLTPTQIKELPTEEIYTIDVENFAISKERAVQSYSYGYHNSAPFNHHRQENLNYSFRSRNDEWAEKEFDLDYFLACRSHFSKGGTGLPKKASVIALPDKRSVTEDIDKVSTFDLDFHMLSVGNFLDFKPIKLETLPVNGNKEGKSTIRIVGEASEGTTLYEVMHTFPPEILKKDVEYLMKKGKLSAQVRSIVYDSKAQRRVIWAGFPFETTTRKDINGKEYSLSVWKNIVERCKCASCNSPLDMENLEFTELTPLSITNRVKVKCPECVTKGMPN